MTEDLFANAINYGIERGGEFVDVRVQDTRGTFVRVIDGRTKEVLTSFNVGAGIRAFIEGAWGFTSTNKLDKTSLREAVDLAVKMAKASSRRAKTKFKLCPPRSLEEASEIPARRKLGDVSIEEKIDFCMKLNHDAQSFDSRVSSVSTSYSDITGSVCVCNSTGTFVKTDINYVYGSAVAYAFETGVRQRGAELVGGAGGFEKVETDEALEVGLKAAEKAVDLLKAKSAPAGRFDCIFDQKLTGLFIHEAFGHACEADSVIAGASVLESKIGKIVGSDLVTVVDDPTLEGLYGSFPYDSEGTRAERKILVDKGFLKGFMNSIETSSRMGTKVNGSARACGYRFPPIVRMSNTYVARGDWEFEEMLEDVRMGVYARGLSYGYTEPAKGQFTFKCEDAFLIEKDELTKHLREVSLSGMILEVLKNVDAVGKDLTFEAGGCGKDSQLIRITTGGPHIRIKNMVVGGVI